MGHAYYIILYTNILYPPPTKVHIVKQISGGFSGFGRQSSPNLQYYEYLT